MQLDGSEFVNELYKEFLNREPDEEGFHKHVHALTNGVPKLELIHHFLESPEATHLFHQSVQSHEQAQETIANILRRLFQLESRTFVTELYREILFREPDPEGLRAWVDASRSVESRKNVVSNILFSVESRKLLGIQTDDQVSSVFRTFEIGALSQGDGTGHTESSSHMKLSRKVSVILLTWNGLEYTKKCLESLQQITKNPAVNVMVFDNASTDGTVEYIQNLRWVNLIPHDKNIGFSAAINEAARRTVPESDIVLLNNDIIARQSNWIELMQETALSDPSIGIVGCRLRDTEGRLQHAGTYIYSETCWGQQIGGLNLDVNQYPRVRDVQGTVFACAYIRRTLIDKIGLLDTDYFAYFEDTDYCLRAREAGYRIVVDGRVTLEHYQNTSTKVNNVDFWSLFEQSKTTFREKWVNKLQNQYVEHVTWSSTVNVPPYGYTNSSIYLMEALDENGVFVSYRYAYGPGTPYPIDEQFTTNSYKVNVYRMRKPHPGGPEVVYAQGDVFFRNNGRYKIGYTMLEVNGLPQEWVRQANLMDEVWVPSRFNKETFQLSGVRVPIHVIPLGVDPNYFNPEIRENRFTEKYTFLSIFEWGERKNPTEIIKTFSKVFSRRDDAVLVCKINNMDPAIDVPSEIRKLGLSVNLSNVMIIYNQQLPTHLMGSLYRSVDSFVLPSRGEGWGMPILEAMASGLPTIATNWSGQTEFLNDQTGYPIRVCKLVPAVAKCPYYEGFRWAEPDFDHMAYLMRYVYEHRDEARAKGLAASRGLLQDWSWSKAAEKISKRLANIH